MSDTKPDLTNIQANILHGSKKWIDACYVFLRIDDKDAAATFIGRLLDSSYVGTAAAGAHSSPIQNVNIAFTSSGFDKLWPSPDEKQNVERQSVRSYHMRPSKYKSPTAETMPGEDGKLSAFEAGMFSANISDEWPTQDDEGTYRWPDDDSQAYAWWSDDEAQQPWTAAGEWPHILVWISADCPRTLSNVYGNIQTLIVNTGGVTEIGCQHAKTLEDRKEHFGFVDGISQPAIDGIRPGKPGDGKLSARGWQGLEVGEFILGYRNEGHQPADSFGSSVKMKDGTFLVYRKLRQDVQAFKKAAAAMSKASEDDAKVMEAKMMGRWHDGDPLVEPPGAAVLPMDASRRNDFTYANDPDGFGCPLGSHVRRSNPRDDLHFEGRRVNRHRIIRRGMPYGSTYDADAKKDEGDRGLIFIAFNARIEDQFEFIQQQWLNGGRPFRIGDDAEPVAGNAELVTGDAEPVAGDRKGMRVIINGEPPTLHLQQKPFTKFLGGDYFFVPSLSALDLIADRATPVVERDPEE